MSFELTSNIKYSRQCMVQRAAQHTVFWSGVAYQQRSEKSLSPRRMRTSQLVCLAHQQGWIWDWKLALYLAGERTTSRRSSRAASLYQVLFQRTRDNRGEEKGEGRRTHWERRVRVLLKGMNSSSSSEISFLFFFFLALLSLDVCVCVFVQVFMCAHLQDKKKNKQTKKL